MKRRMSGVVLLCLMAATSGHGQAKSATPANKTIVLKAARMYDGKGDALVKPGVVVVADGKITAAGPTASVPAGAEVIDLGDATLLPGFIDAHTHLTGMYSDDWKQATLDRLQKTVAEQALDASVNARVTLMAGFTTVRDVGSRDSIDVGLRNAIANGKIAGPRMLVSVHAIGATGGHCDEGGYRQGLFPETGPWVGVINGADQAREAVRLAHKYGADIIKTCATGGVLSLTDDVDTPQLTQEELNAIVDEAHTLRKKTAAHAHGAEGAKRAIRAGIDSIEHGAFLDDEAIDLMKARGTFYIPTLMAAEGGREILAKGGYPPPVAAKMTAAIESIGQVVRKAVAKGVKIGMGTDAAVYPHGRNTEEFHLLTALGMSPIDALRAATSVDAELLGMQGQIGALETGRLADIIVMPADPLLNIRQTEKVFFVMKDGVIYRDDRPQR